MPALPNVPNVARFAVGGHQSSQKWVNVFYIRNTVGPWGSADMATMAARLRTQYITRFGASLSSVGGIDSVSGQDLTSPTAATVIDTTTAAFTGGAAATSPQVAFVLGWRIQRRYRGGHPRTYLPCVLESDVDTDGNVAAGTKGTLNAAITSFTNDITSTVLAVGAAEHVAVHYFQNGVILASPVVDIIFGGTCRSVVGTQRRRLPPIR